MRKIFALLLLLILFLVAYAKPPRKGDLNLSGLPISVTTQWKFHAGDNSVWADTTFDDGTWKHLDLTQPQYFLPQVQREVSWFRLTIDVAPSLRGKVVALIVNQYGAAEIYFNGVLIRKTGRVSADYNIEKTYRSVSEPLILQFNAHARQFIAIRYSNNKSNLVIGYGRPVIEATLKQVESGWADFFYRIDFYTTRSWVAGCFMLLAILQLAIYFFNRERKVNLYLSVYAFMQFITLSDGLMMPMLQSNNWHAVMVSLFNIAAPLDFVFLMMMTFAFFDYTRSKWFMILAVLALPVIVLQFIGNNAHNEHVLAIYNGVCYIEIIRISVKAFNQKKGGAGLFLVGILLSMVFFVTFSIGYAPYEQPLLFCFEVAFAFLIPAIILSVLLAREFAQNLISLRQKLAEVESLSAKNLAHEIEKQQILADQNQLLEQQVADRTAELNNSLINLKQTQTQLIQSEKMASLGELTAGIAHEIQNPLNFVNNFSEVNREMIDELEHELKAGNVEEALAIAVDVKQNEQKINHHGKRADAIVKGMLEHSRASTGQKEPTDLNVLADEYLRLAYHGLRAKNKNFNAELITNFDGNLPKVNVIPQDIGRVLLNLFNNAFYAVNQKQNKEKGEYKPKVTVSTSVENEWLTIRIKDNGIGIPDAIKEKIMQPFFTTKPTGEGTGLGLSLSYDIVVKGHGGIIQIDSKEGEWSEFVISLPLNSELS
ncbi:MAG: ATP-binding protein [Mucilaginibacter sp.]